MKKVMYYPNVRRAGVVIACCAIPVVLTARETLDINLKPCVKGWGSDKPTPIISYELTTVDIIDRLVIECTKVGARPTEADALRRAKRLAEMQVPRLGLR